MSQALHLNAFTCCCVHFAIGDLRVCHSMQHLHHRRFVADIITMHAHRTNYHLTQRTSLGESYGQIDVKYKRFYYFIIIIWMAGIHVRRRRQH